MAAVNQTTVPWCTIIVRNAFGVAGVVHQQPTGTRCATPGRRLLGRCAGRRHRGRLSRRHRRRRRSEAKWGRSRTVSTSCVRRFVRRTVWVEEIIDPRKTRSLLCEFARLAEPIRTPGPGDQHDHQAMITSPYGEERCLRASSNHGQHVYPSRRGNWLLLQQITAQAVTQG